MGDLTEENQTTEDGSGDFHKSNSHITPSYNIDQHLEFIDISEDGHLLLGSSNLIVKNWGGSIWLFNNSDVVPTEEESICNLCCTSCVSCGLFIDSWEKIIIGEDTGKLTIYTVPNYDDNTLLFLPNLSADNHDGSIVSLCLTNGNSTAVSAGSDLRINLWDNNSLEIQQKYMPAHSTEITSVISSHDKSSNLFTSCGLDGLALLWDSRQSKPASSIFDHDFGLTSMAWKDENILALGSLTGDVHLSDIRNKNLLHTFSFNKHSVHHIEVCPTGEMAVCGNTNQIKAWDLNTFKLIYTNTSHTAFVRWLSWNPANNNVYSCGFDKRIYSHMLCQDMNIDNNGYID